MEVPLEVGALTDVGDPLAGNQQQRQPILRRLRTGKPAPLISSSPETTERSMHLDIADSVDTVAHIIQVALTPVFLLSGIASLLGVISTRLARVADRVDSLSEKIESARADERPRLARRLNFLKRRSHILDVAVMMGALAGVATSISALLLFVGTLREKAGNSLFFAFGLALVLTCGALTAFLAEMLLASRGVRDQAAGASEAGEVADGPEEQGHGIESTGAQVDGSVSP